MANEKWRQLTLFREDQGSGKLKGHCPFCGREFEMAQEKQKACSALCAGKFQKPRRRVVRPRQEQGVFRFEA
jgi:hypothetical protein